MKDLGLILNTSRHACGLGRKSIHIQPPARAIILARFIPIRGFVFILCTVIVDRACLFFCITILCYYICIAFVDYKRRLLKFITKDGRMRHNASGVRPRALRRMTSLAEKLSMNALLTICQNTVIYFRYTLHAQYAHYIYDPTIHRTSTTYFNENAAARVAVTASTNR